MEAPDMTHHKLTKTYLVTGMRLVINGQEVQLYTTKINI